MKKKYSLLCSINKTCKGLFVADEVMEKARHPIIVVNDSWINKYTAISG